MRQCLRIKFVRFRNLINKILCLLKDPNLPFNSLLRTRLSTWRGREGDLTMRCLCAASVQEVETCLATSMRIVLSVRRCALQNNILSKTALWRPKPVDKTGFQKSHLFMTKSIYHTRKTSLMRYFHQWCSHQRNLFSVTLSPPVPLNKKSNRYKLFLIKNSKARLRAINSQVLFLTKFKRLKCLKQQLAWDRPNQVRIKERLLSERVNRRKSYKLC